MYKAPYEPHSRHENTKMRLTWTAEMEKQLRTAIENKCIQPSSSEFGSPPAVLFMAKNTGKVRIVIDTRPLNITEKDGYPVPQIEDPMVKLACELRFSEADMVNAYHQVSVHPQNQNKTDLFESRELPFSIANGPACFVGQALTGNNCSVSRLHYRDWRSLEGPS